MKFFNKVHVIITSVYDSGSQSGGKLSPGNNMRFCGG